MSVAPQTPRRRLTLATDGPAETRALAARLAEALVDGDVLVLSGDLGAGKTCFTQGLGAGLGVEDPITSPTFALANRYRGRLTLHHLDAYRLDGEADATDLAIDELIEDGVTVIEWGDRIEGLLPEARFTVWLRWPESLDDDPDRRHLELDGPIAERGLEAALADWVAR